MKKLLVPILWLMFILLFIISAFDGRIMKISSPLYSTIVIFISF